MRRTRMAIAFVSLASGVAWAAAPSTAGIDDGVQTTADPVRSGEWQFRALLDGSPIGEHRFSVRVEGDRYAVTSDASFDVKLLGLSVYRYRHHAVEHWRGGCLQDIDATTDDNGKTARVEGERQGDGVAVSGPDGRQTLPGCVMTFAYWNPGLLARTHLLNAQTGRYENVRVATSGSGSVDVRGRTVVARQLRINATEGPIDLWISPQGEWIGLDTTVDGGRKLSYRLE